MYYGGTCTYLRTYMHGTIGLRFVSRSIDNRDYVTSLYYLWSQQVKTITVCQAFIMNSDGRGSQTSQKKRASGC